jgi:Protein of unknown function (DUF2950)
MQVTFSTAMSGSRVLLARVLLGMALYLTCAPAMAAEPKNFATPEEAAQALLDAAASDDMDAIWVILGDEKRDELANPDQVQERENRRQVVSAAKDAMQLRADDPDTRVMVIGKEAWPMPIPIVKGNNGWYFDTAAGADEIIARRIGTNELASIDNLRAYVDAQVQYAAADRDGDQVLEYAQRINSTEGQKDGLYWETAAESDEELSPFGPFVGEHAAYLDDRDVGDPFMGYYYRIVSRQGEHAPGGRYDYVINGNMIGGFAMIAWPAEYGSSGIMTFTVSQTGKVYQKDLGEGTAPAAAAIQIYDPDESWSEVSD